MAEQLPKPEERRQHPRYRCTLKMSYSLMMANGVGDDAKAVEVGVAHSSDISLTGLCIYVAQPLPISSLVQLNISLPVRPFHLLILAKVTRCNTMADSHNNCRVGLRFVGGAPPEFRRLLQSLPLSEDSAVS